MNEEDFKHRLYDIMTHRLTGDLTYHPNQAEHDWWMCEQYAKKVKSSNHGEWDDEYARNKFYVISRNIS